MTKFFIFVFLIFSLCLHGKRLAPNKVSPVIHEGKEYIVNVSQPGTIQIINLSNKTSKTVVIYTIQYKPDLEKDVQDVFIKTIQKKDKSLLIKNERDESFLLNFESNHVTKIMN